MIPEVLVPEKAPIETESKKKPFVIRGHHLRLFELLLKTSSWDPKLTPDSLVNLMVKNYEKFRDLGDGSNLKSISRADYAIDIIGMTPEEEKSYGSRAKEVFNQFLQLSPDSPVDIAMGPDNLCMTCATHLHCTNTQNSEGNEVTAIEDKYVESFIKYIREYPKVEVGKTTLTDEVRQFQGSNAGLKVLKRIRTTAGTVRNVLTRDPLPWEMVVDSYFPSQRQRHSQQ